MRVTALCCVVALSVVLCASFAGAKEQPNIIFILTDDQDLLLGSLNYMPLLKQYLLDEGAFFDNYFVGTPLCCPSRASMLRGQYAHNTHIVELSPPGGGVAEFRQRGLENSTIGTWLQNVGYETAFFGKYMNSYPCATLAKGYVPPGWSDWFALCDPFVYNYYNSRYTNNGVIEDHPDEYQTDALGNRTVAFIKNRDPKKPFFIHLSGVAPHQPATPATRHKNLFPNLKAPRTPSFNQADVSKEPSFVKLMPKLTVNQTNEIDELFRNRLRALQAVDDNVEKIIDELRAQHILNNTYIFYTADNGFHLGQHRFTPGKREPYEEDVRVPFIVRGPGVPKNVTISANVQNVDLGPTFAALAGAQIPKFVDGLSLISLLTGTPSPAAQAAFRPIVLSENFGDPADEVVRDHPTFVNNTWQSIRILNPQSDVMFSSWCTNEYQHYDVKSDPYQLNNTFSEQTDAHNQKLYATLKAMALCAADTCHNVQLPKTDGLEPIRPCFVNKL